MDNVPFVYFNGGSNGRSYIVDIGKNAMNPSNNQRGVPSQPNKSKSWTKFIDIDGEKLLYGFIDEGGEKYGNRYFVTVRNHSVDVNIAEDLVKLCEMVEQAIKSGWRP